MKRYLGIDYGQKRIGLAIADDSTGVAMAIGVVQVRGPMAEQVVEVLRASSMWSYDAFVVGLPLNMDGTEGPQAEITRRFGVMLAEQSGIPVEYQDERLTSAEALNELTNKGFSQKGKKSRIDAVAAKIILEEFLVDQSNLD